MPNRGPEYEHQKVLQKEIYRSRILNGKCGKCGKDSNDSMCWECKEINYKAHRRWREKRNAKERRAANSI
jgi:hypothetical protein